MSFVLQASSQDTLRNRAPVVLMNRESVMDMDDDDDENFDNGHNNDDLSTETPVSESALAWTNPLLPQLSRLVDCILL